VSQRPVTPVTFDEIERARSRIDDESVVKTTPIEVNTSLGDTVDADVRLKMEHLQWTGSFKTRGAYNKLKKCVEEEQLEACIAASAGNHAQGVALAATKLGLDATIVMPKTAPQTKVDATRGYGATVELVGRNFQEAKRRATELTGDPGTVFVDAYDDRDIVAGQGTLGMELHEQLPDVDTVVVPVGGGGLISGVATAFAELAPEVRVVGVQADKAATVPDSLDKGIPQTVEEVDTIADGIATGGISELTLASIRDHVDEVVTVSDDDISRAVLLLLERAKQVVEGAGAASVAAILDDDLDVSGETVAPLLSGGNLDMTMLQTTLIHALTARRQLLRLEVLIDDVPGQMADLSDVIADHGANIRSVRHDRAVEDLDVGEAYLVFEIETSGATHAHNIIEAIADRGYEVSRINGEGAVS